MWIQIYNKEMMIQMLHGSEMRVKVCIHDKNLILNAFLIFYEAIFWN